MHTHTVGFVGGGRITAIFLQAPDGRGLALDRVTVSDTSREVLSRLEARFAAVTTTVVNAEAAACERVFLALHLLDSLGAHPVVPEETLEAYAILVAMGPTCFWFQWRA
jgi:pyrroline-5-carboxylate reductase